MNAGVIKFNGIQSDQSSLGILAINRIDRAILPEMRNKLFEINRREGALDFGRDLQPRYIDIRFTMKSANIEQLREHSRNIAEWLYTPDLSELVIGDEQDKFYLARVASQISQEQILNLGICEMSFVVPDVWAYDENLTSVINDGIVSFTNDGTVATSYYLQATINELTASSFKIALSDTEFIELEVDLVQNDVIEIDSGMRTILLNDDDIRDKLTIESSWFMLPSPGGNLTADPISTDLELYFRKRYI